MGCGAAAPLAEIEVASVPNMDLRALVEPVRPDVVPGSVWKASNVSTPYIQLAPGARVTILSYEVDY